MIKYFFVFVLTLRVLFSNENVVKTSELELFLFKVGFESLLKDVDITKDRTSLNEKEIKLINEKIELIMAELYKNKRVLLNNSTEDSTNLQETQNKTSNKELENLKSEIAFLKNEITKLKEDKKVAKPIPKKKIVSNHIKKEPIKQNSKRMRVATKFLAVYKEANTDSQVVRNEKRDSIIFVEKCEDGWCKLKNENFFVRGFLIKAN